MEKNGILKRYLPDIYFALALVAVFFSVYAALPSCGFISSFPILIVEGVILGAVFGKILKYSLFGTVFASFLALVTIDGWHERLLFTGAIFAVLVLSQWAALVFIKRRNRLWIVGAFLVLALSVFVYTSAFGTVSSNDGANKAAREHLSTIYPKESFEKLRTYYSPKDGIYITSFEFYDSLKTAEGKIYHNDVISDTYAEYAVGVLAEKGRIAATTALRNALPDAKFTVEESSADLDAVKVSRRLTLSGEDTLSDMLSYSVTVHDECPSRFSFREEIKKYFGILKSSGFVFDRVIFFGGDQNAILYRAETEYEMSEEEVISSVTKP